MCGIAGIIKFTNSVANLQSQLFEMALKIRHRGPDDEGYFLENNEGFQIKGGQDTPQNCYEYPQPYQPSKQENTDNNFHIGLAHRRLSIIDINPSGHQPMCDQSQDYWMVYNGEIYNYLEIKKKLIAAGVSIVTASDTEVVLKAYILWGERCVEYFNGMWALAIYNRKTQMLFCSRDRFGVKPFYYIFNKNHFAFASEQKALLDLQGNNRGVNHKAAFQYLALGTTESEAQGLFEGIVELMPAHHLQVDIKNSKINIDQYYSLAYNAEYVKTNKNDTQKYVEQTKGLFTEAIKLRLQSDATVGSCLSGGIDSSSIVCTTDMLMQQNYLPQIGNKLKVFTAVFPNQKIDESKWAEIVVNNTKTEWHKIEPQPEDIVKNFEQLTYAQDIPILSTSTFAQFKVMEKIHAEGIKVTLDGQGADELFAGYMPHYNAYFYETICNGDLKQFLYNSSHLNQGLGSAKYLLQSPIKNWISSFLPALTQSIGFKNFRKEFSYINNDFWQNNKTEITKLQTRFTPHLNQMLHQQFTSDALKVLLRTGDRNSMNFSIESRVPFADDLPLIEATFNIPSSYKIQNNQSKYLLRQSMINTVPNQILQRTDKLGFSTPEHNWLKNNSNFFKAYIDDSLSDFIDVKKLLYDWDQLLHRLPTEATQRFFRIIQFAAWKKTFKL